MTLYGISYMHESSNIYEWSAPWGKNHTVPYIRFSGHPVPIFLDSRKCAWASEPLGKVRMVK